MKEAEALRLLLLPQSVCKRSRGPTATGAPSRWFPRATRLGMASTHWRSRGIEGEGEGEEGGKLEQVRGLLPPLAVCALIREWRVRTGQLFSPTYGTSMIVANREAAARRAPYLCEIFPSPCTCNPRHPDEPIRSSPPSFPSPGRPSALPPTAIMNESFLRALYVHEFQGLGIVPLRALRPGRAHQPHASPPIHPPSIPQLSSRPIADPHPIPSHRTASHRVASGPILSARLRSPLASSSLSPKLVLHPHVLALLLPPLLLPRRR